MIPVSNEFKKALGNDSRNYIIQIDMTLHDGTELTLNNSDIWDGGVSFEEATSSTNSFDIGTAVIGKCTIVLNNIYDKFSQYDFFGATFTLYIGLELSETTEMIQKGFYTVEDPKYNGSIITLECLDNMWKFDVPYSEVSTVYPATVGVIVADICLHCGVTLAKANFPNHMFTILRRPEEDMNCREVISYLAQISCLYAKISNNGALIFSWYDANKFACNYDGGYFDSGTPQYESGDNLDGGNFTDYSSGDDADGGTFEDLWNISYIISTSSISVNTDDIHITGIRLIGESEESFDYLYGNADYVLVIKDNPFVHSGNYKEIARYIGNRIMGLFFRPFQATALNDVSIEAGDACIIQDFRGNRYYSFVTNLSFSVWNYESFSCGAETPNRNKTVRYSELAKTAVQIRRETQEKISEYDKAVQNMNQLASNAMGYHTTYEEQEDGSRITYLHDKPNLSESTIIYKQTIDGFFVSQDGGKSYTLGFDSNGNAVVNILYAIGIVADWIKGGTLTLGGINNINGLMHIVDSNGKLIGRWDNDGIFINKGEIKGPSIIVGGLNNTNGSIIVLDAEGNHLGVWDNENFLLKSKNYVPAKYKKEQSFPYYEQKFNKATYYTSDYAVGAGGCEITFDNTGSNQITISYYDSLDFNKTLKTYTFTTNNEKVTVTTMLLGTIGTAGIVKITSSSLGIKSISIYNADGSIKISRVFDINSPTVGSIMSFKDNKLSIGDCMIDNGFFVKGKRLGATEYIGKCKSGETIAFARTDFQKYSSLSFILMHDISYITPLCQVPASVLDRTSPYYQATTKYDPCLKCPDIGSIRGIYIDYRNSSECFAFSVVEDTTKTDTYLYVYGII